VTTHAYTAAPLAGALDEAAVSRIAREQFDFVWRFLLRLGVASADAEDMAQQVFLVLWNKRSELRLENERAYVAGVARGIASTYRRTQRRRRDGGEATGEAVDQGLSPEGHASFTEASDVLKRILSGLSEEEREVFILFEIEGWSTPEIAEAVQAPVGTIASRLRRARERVETAASKLLGSAGETSGGAQ
jgi:RNA polymerase sigma-70 factor (ECF subfamily)